MHLATARADSVFSPSKTRPKTPKMNRKTLQCHSELSQNSRNSRFLVEHWSQLKVFLEGLLFLENSLVLKSLNFNLDYGACPSEALLGCIPLISKTGIEEFVVEKGGRHNCAHACFSLNDAEDVLKALKCNLVLRTCPFSVKNSVCVEDTKQINSHKKTIFELNRNGRRYLVEGKSKRRGDELLAAVANDLNCIYYHLLEYPALCCTNNQSNINNIEASPSGDATDSDDDAEEDVAKPIAKKQRR